MSSEPFLAGEATWADISGSLDDLLTVAVLAPENLEPAVAEFRATLMQAVITATEYGLEAGINKAIDTFYGGLPDAALN